MPREKLRAYRNIKTERDQLKELILDLESTIYTSATQRLAKVHGSSFVRGDYIDPKRVL